MGNIDYKELYEKGLEMCMEYGPRVLGAILVLIVGTWLIKALTRGFTHTLDRSKVDSSLKAFLTSMVNMLLRVIMVLTALNMVGIAMTSFIAILGAAGLAVGMALSGTLQNFAGGVMILIFKPYKVDDLIEAQGHLGFVKEIQIFVTVLLTHDNKTVIIPNGPLSNGDITNYTTQGKIRVELVMGISYDSDIRKSKEVLLKVMNAHPKVLQDPAPFVGVLELADSSVNLAVRPYADPADYWDVYFDIYEQGKIALDEANITIPFPQVDVHMIPQDK